MMLIDLITIIAPSATHDTFCARIVEEISRQVSQFQQVNGPVANFPNEVEYFLTSRILIPRGKDTEMDG